MSNKLKLGTQVNEIRKGKNYSQIELASEELNKNTIVRIEKNVNSPSVDTLNIIVNNLGIDFCTLTKYNEYANFTDYYRIKDSIEDCFATLNWSKAKLQYELISKDMYDSLPLREQQYVDIIQIELVKHIERNYRKAELLAKKSLNKTLKAGADFFSHNEMELINIIFQFDQSSQHMELIERVLNWLEGLPDSLQDFPAYLLLLNGYSTYFYEIEDWNKSYTFASKGYDVAIRSNGLKFIPSFLFTKGLCLVKLGQDVGEGKKLLKDSLEFCKLIRMEDFYGAIIHELEKYNINLNQDL
ncbi:helix-turn-helix domain-containing protein [Culicoidibacter larvae]|uniref:helix-turn-helix domain-containing protein n=1 Tax=Culicoidibacter larvae TaxID=2579976 RepID=UPI0014856BD8|nr:helix-turn-helix transcriptional regulator [Culicoidibacter larvae]